MVESVFDFGVNRIALEKGLVRKHSWNPRDFATDKHKTVDDRPFGGGPGMVMQYAPLCKSIQAAKEKLPDPWIVYLSPHGNRLNHQKVMELLQKPSLLLLCGRYEGIDQRIIDRYVDEQISIGDYVLSGGELAAMVVVDSLLRQIPGVLGHEQSAQQDSFVEGLLDCPHYTRPEEIDGLRVPSVLLGGNHEKIAQWRRKQSLGLTWKYRPDLLEGKQLSEQDQHFLDEYIQQSKIKK